MDGNDYLEPLGVLKLIVRIPYGNESINKPSRSRNAIALHLNTICIRIVDLLKSVLQGQ